MKLLTLDHYPQPIPIVTGIEPLNSQSANTNKVDKKEEQNLASMINVLRKFFGNKATNGDWQKQMEIFGGAGWSKSSFDRRLRILKAKAWVTVVGKTHNVTDGAKTQQGDLLSATDLASNHDTTTAETQTVIPKNQSQPNQRQPLLERGVDTADTGFEAEEDQKAVSRRCH
jgi:hypothetical protein